MHIEGETFDDLLRASLQGVMERGHHIAPSKGNARELIGVNLRLANPLARFSRTESRGVLFSALGETLWYLSGSDDFDVIEHYIPKYRERCGTPANVPRSEAAYGPRLAAQLPFILKVLQKKDTRKAVISIYREADHSNKYDVPCTCTLQFFPRSGTLHALAQMRSNDVYTGMAHDVFAFTLLQEFLARASGLEVGTYVHQVGSFHLYETDAQAAARYLDGGLTDNIPMDPMPTKDPRGGLDWLLKAETSLRLNCMLPSSVEIDPYWRDLATLLRVRPLRWSKDQEELRKVRDAMHSQAFRTFIQDEIGRV